MIDSNNILSLFGIPSEQISSYEVIKDDENIYYIDLELKDNRPNCPFCFNDKVNIKDYYNIKIK